ncbi:CBS domain-containing protein [Candidatus Bipolaricaulota bacterium]|nr:CBS domain-containing protein [Candidatus Bipolaricaulota bacterium]
MSPSTLHVAIIDQLIQPRIHIRLLSIMTPLRELVVARPRERVAEAIARASSGSFDQLPVVNDEGRVAGLVYVDQLQSSPADATVSDYLVPLEKCRRLRIEDGISRAVRILHTQPASLVADGEKIAGLVHRSDLNKHAARTYFYLWLSALEMGLARLVALRLPGDSWIELLRKRAREKVLDKMECESRRNNSIAPIEYLNLSELVEIIEKNEPLYRELGFDSRSKVKAEVGRLVELRHTIMHPVRTLVPDATSMDVLANRERKLRAVTLTVQRILKRA